MAWARTSAVPELAPEHAQLAATLREREARARRSFDPPAKDPYLAYKEYVRSVSQLALCLHPALPPERVQAVVTRTYLALKDRLLCTDGRLLFDTWAVKFVIEEANREARHISTFSAAELLAEALPDEPPPMAPTTEGAYDREFIAGIISCRREDITRLKQDCNDIAVHLVTKGGFRDLADEAQDVAQTTALKVINKIRGFEGRNGARLWSWIYSIARNEMLGRVRSKRRAQERGARPEAGLEPEASLDPDMTEDFMTRIFEQHHHVFVARLSRLDFLRRVTFEFKLIFQLEYDEIVSWMDVVDDAPAPDATNQLRQWWSREWRSFPREQSP